MVTLIRAFLVEIKSHSRRVAGWGGQWTFSERDRYRSMTITNSLHLTDQKA